MENKQNTELKHGHLDITYTLPSEIKIANNYGIPTLAEIRDGISDLLGFSKVTTNKDKSI